MRELKIPNNEVIHVQRGALLHEIGKIGIPDQILLKTGPVDEGEWGIMRRHPALAYEVLNPIAYLRPAPHIPLHHPEQWDGSGYPYRLRGAFAPLPARIFSVVDVWDALTSDRPPRKACSREKVLEYLRGQSGSHYAPEVLK